MEPRIDPEVAKWGIAAAAVVFAVFLVGTAYVWARFSAVAGSAQGKLVAFSNSENVLRLGTVFAVIGAAAILALAGALTEGAAALFSGIAGYVLGGLQREGHGALEKRKEEVVDA